MNLFPTLACKSSGRLGAHCFRWLLPHPGCFPLASIYRSVLSPGLRRPSLRSRFLFMQPPHFAVLPCSFQPRCHRWAGISVAVTQKDHSVLSSLSLTSPGNCSGQETRLICCPSLSLLNHSHGAALPMVQCLRRVSYLSGFFFFFKLFKAGSKPGPLWV